jgi:hypothetical protein
VSYYVTSLLSFKKTFTLQLVNKTFTNWKLYKSVYVTLKDQIMVKPRTYALELLKL